MKPPDSLLSIEELDRLEEAIPLHFEGKGYYAFHNTDKLRSLLSTARLAHRYRKAIKKAPHEERCSWNDRHGSWEGSRLCNCWKSQALNKEE